MSFGPRRLAALGFLLAVSSLGVVSLLWADTVHLKNGGTIACDSIEERGADLVLRVGKMTIVVPRDEVERIEVGPKTGKPAPPPSGASPSQPGASGSAAAPSGAGEAKGHEAEGDAKADAARLEELKRRLQAEPLARDENRRQIVALLDRMGERALSERKPEEARRRFTEAAGYDPADLRARRGLGAALLMLDRTAEARTTIERALLDAPQDADLNYLLGEAFERLGRADQALAALEKAYAARPTPTLRDRIATLKRQHGVDGAYRRSEAARFTLTYDGARTSPQLEAEILAFLEGQYPELALLFDYSPAESIAVILYPEQDFYAATAANRDVAGLYDGKVRVPSGGLRRLDPGAREVLRHELAHAFIAGKSRGACPRWLHEGLAQWVEGRRPGPAGETRLAREYRAEPSRWGTLFDYDSALSFVAYLLAQHGQTALNDVLAVMGRGLTAEAAFVEVLRDPLPTLRTAWGDELVRDHLP
ncbi:MAG TPA: tetratricopeptide repeat protein [Candidatus Polarisedimenticolia bacterium]|nr:tetratricopeptide repeat protein [Candidatus Polarisedimenticolia bacterium]